MRGALWATLLALPIAGAAQGQAQTGESALQRLNDVSSARASRSRVSSQSFAQAFNQGQLDPDEIHAAGSVCALERVLADVSVEVFVGQKSGVDVGRVL